MRESNVKWFYRDFGFYAKYGMVLYAFRDIVLNSITSILVIIVNTLLWTSTLAFTGIGGALFISFFIIILFREAFVSYMNTLRERSGVTIFVTTLIITSISYFVFRVYFNDPVAIWGVAFGTGSACALLMNLLIKVTRGTAFESLLFSDDDILIKRWVEKPLGRLMEWLEEKVMEPVGTMVYRVFYAL